MSQSSNGRPLSRIQKALHEQIPNEQERAVYHEIAIRGRAPSELAGDLALSEVRVQRIVYRVRRWIEQVRIPIDVHGLQALHLQRLEHQWHEAMSAWYRSGKKEETIKSSYEDLKKKQATDKRAPATAVKPANDDGKRKVERTSREPCGDVRYLEQARKIMAEVRALSAEALATRTKEQRDVTELTAAERDAEAAAQITAIRQRDGEAAD